MNAYKQSFGISFALAAIAAAFSVAAHAEYRCDAPAASEDRVACELAKLDRSDELRLFIERTKSIYGLYFDDYVSQRDVDRWDSAREHEEAQSITTAERAKEKSRN